jgi:NADPH2:quinone reductase
MFAWRAHEYGPFRDVLVTDEIAEPSPPDAGVVVDVAAVGLNFFDILSIAGQYQVKAPLPFVPGTEVVGRVRAAGSRSRFAVGDRIVAHNIVGACAEAMAAPDQGCFPIPDTVDDADALALAIVYQTSYFALVHRAALCEGEVLLVHGGAGAVGSAAIQLGKVLGATVIATASTEAKREVCLRSGADHVIDSVGEDFVAVTKRVTSGRGADVVFDPVGGDVFDASLKCMAWEGRLVVIGFAGGRIPEVRANRILLKNIAVVGLNWGGYQFQDPARHRSKIAAAHEALLRLHAEGRIDPVVTADWTLRELPQALAAIADRRSHGKVVLTREVG